MFFFLFLVFLFISEKMYKISDSIGCVVAGLTSDANILINKLRIYAQNHLFQFDEPIPVEQLVRQIADLKQSYTQFGGLRPFGISFLYAGYDDLHGYQLYQSDPSGNYSGWKATAIGGNTQAAQSVLKSEYKDDITLDKAIGLALRVLAKSVDSVALSSKKVDIAVMTKVRNAPIFDILGQERVDELIKQHAEEISKSREDHD